MAKTVETLVVKVTADTTKAQSDLKKLGTTSGSTGSSFKDMALGVATGTAAIQLATKAFQILKDASIDSILNASNAQETYSKFSVVFSDVFNEAERLATELDDLYGFSKAGAQAAISGVADIAQGLGATAQKSLQLSETLVKLAADTASFSNYAGGASGATKALTGLLVGERDAAKALGIVITDDSLKKYAEDMGLVYKEMTKLEKGELSLKLAVDQSKNSIDDVINTSGNFANVLREAKNGSEDLSSAIGTGMIPAATTIVSFYGRATKALADFLTEQNNIIAAEKAVLSGTATTSQKILDMYERRKEIIIEIEQTHVAMSSSADGWGQTVLDAYQAELNAITDNLRWLELEEKARNAVNAEAKESLEIQAKAAEIAAANSSELSKYLKEVEDAYKKTKQGQIDAKKADIAYWETMLESAVKTAPQVNAILTKLREDLSYLTQTEEEAVDTTEKVTKKYSSAWVDAYAMVMEARTEAMDQHKLLTESDNTMLASKMSNIKALFDYQVEMAEAEKLLNQQKLDSSTSLFNGVASIMGAFGKQTRAMVIAQKALAITQIAISTGVAFMNTLATGGPFPWNVINAAGVLATGVAQGIAVASTSVPSFATGTPSQGYVVPPGFDDDTFPVQAKSGETVTVGDNKGSEGNVHIEFMLDGVKVGSAMTSLIRDRKITISEGDVV